MADNQMETALNTTDDTKTKKQKIEEYMAAYYSGLMEVRYEAQNSILKGVLRMQANKEPDEVSKKYMHDMEAELDRKVDELMRAKEKVLAARKDEDWSDYESEDEDDDEDETECQS